MNFRSVVALFFVCCLGYIIGFSSSSSFFRLSLTHKNACKTSDHLFATEAADSVDVGVLKSAKSATDIDGSVHLKLTQAFDIEHKGNDTVAESIEIFEYITEKSNETLLACVGDIEAHHFEHFSLHMLNQNLSSTTGVKRIKKQLDLTDNSTVQKLVDLWRAEKLLANSKDFPFDVMKRKQKDDLQQTLLGYVGRLKRLREEKKTTDVLIKGFLSSQNLSRLDWREFAFDSGLSRADMMVTLKKFAQWFRSEFPYYYDNCIHCGNKRTNEFYGLVYPSIDERPHLAGRTELYLCSCCNQTTRFPRFNAVCKVLETRKGRCGEYSMLVFRMLEMLGYRARWAVDWADHVWAEVLIDGDWLHFDPCEAAVDEPLIYQGWGKNQTFIFSISFDHVEDVTLQYTTDHAGVEARRALEGVTPAAVQAALARAREELLLDVGEAALHSEPLTARPPPRPPLKQSLECSQRVMDVREE